MASTKPVNKAAVRYGLRLRAALEETGTSIYRLSRQINPQAPESARSNIQRYLRGAVLPSIEKRFELATALGRDDLKSATSSDDDEEADPVALMTALFDRAAELAVERRLAVREAGETV